MTNKIQEFIKRNRKRNASLYMDSAVLGVDYVECPVSKERLVMITKPYITNVLGLDPDVYFGMYPNIQKVASAKSTRTSETMNKTDSNGVSIKDMKSAKISATKKAIDSDGTSIAMRAAKKASKTRTTITENGMTNAQNSAAIAIVNGNITKSKRGMIELSDSEYKWYCQMSSYLLELFYGNVSKSLKFKMKAGYESKISPLMLCHESNVTLTEATNNDWRSSTTETTLLNTLNMSREEATDAFLQFIEACTWCINKHGAMSCGLVYERLTNARESYQ